MGLSQSILNEQNRSKLDSIVSKMQSNGESEDNIRFVVDDFKQKYSEKKNGSLQNGGTDLNSGTPDISPSLSESQLQLNGSKLGQFDILNNPLNIKQKPTISIAGIPVKLDTDLAAPIPLQTNYNPEALAKELQDRIDTKTFNQDDVNVVAKSMKVSPKAANAYLQGNVGTGTVIHFDEVKADQKDQLKSLVQKANSDLGLNDNYDVNLATPEMAGTYINKIQKMYDEKAKKEIEAKSRESVTYIPTGVSGNSGFSQLGQEADVIRDQNINAAQQIKSIVTNDIIDKISADNTLTKDQKVKKIYQLSDGIDAKNVDKAISNRLSPFGYIKNLVLSNSFTDSGTTEDIDLLNANKAGIEYKLNKNLEDNLSYNTALKNSIIESYNNAVSDGGINPNDAAVKKEYTDKIADINLQNQNISKQIASDKEIFEKYPTLQKAAIASAVNEYNAIQSGNVKGYEEGGYANATLPEYLAGRGFDVKDQKVIDFVNGNNFKDYSFFGNPLQSAVDVFSSTLKSLGDITHLRDDATRLAEKRQAEIFPTVPGENDEFKLTEAAKIGQNIGSTTGQVIGQGLLQAGTAGLGRMAGLTKLAATNAAFWTSGSLTSYDQAYKDSYDFIDSGLGRTAYAGLIALSNAASERIFPDIKLFQIPGVQDAIADLSKKIGTKEFTTELAKDALGKVKNSMLAYGKEFGKDVGKETVEEVSTQLFEDGLRFISGDPNANFGKAIENAKNTAIQTATGMLAIGAYGAHKTIKQEKNTSPQSTIFNAGLYHDEAVDAINKGYEQKLYSEDERNEKIKTLNTAQKAIQTLSVTEKITGTSLPRPKKELYVANLTAEALLTEQLKNNEDPLAKKVLEEKISNLQNQRKELLDGSVDIDEDGNIIVPQKIKENEKQVNNTATQTSQSGNIKAADQTPKGGASEAQQKILNQIEDDRAADLAKATDSEKQGINDFYDTVKAQAEAAAEYKPTIRDDFFADKHFNAEERAAYNKLDDAGKDAMIDQKREALKNIIPPKPTRHATTSSPEGQQQASSTEGGIKEHTPANGGQQVQTAGTETQPGTDNSNLNISSEEKALVDKVREKKVPNLINDQFGEDENLKFLQEQSISAPNGFKNQIGGDEDLATDLIATNSKEAINEAIAFQEKQLKAPDLSYNDITEIDNHIQLLEKGLAKKEANEPKKKPVVRVKVGTPPQQQKLFPSTVKSEEVKVVENKIKSNGVDAVTSKDIVGLSAEEVDNKVRFTQEESKVISDHYKDVSELKRLQDEAIKMLTDGSEIDAAIGQKMTNLSDKIKEQEKSLPKGTVKGKINDGIPSFSDLVAFDYSENINDWKGRVVDIGGTVYAIGMDGKMKPIPFVEWDVKSRKYKEIKKPDRAEKYGDTVPKSGSFIVSHGSPNGLIEKFDENKLGKGFQKEELDHEKFEGVYASDNTDANAILGTGYGDVHEYNLEFNNSISEPKAEKLLKEHEKQIGKTLSRKEASKFTKSLGYDMIYRSEGDGTYTFVGLDVNKITPKSETKPITQNEGTATKTVKSVQSNEPGQEQQGNKEQVQQGAESNSGTATAATTTIPTVTPAPFVPPKPKRTAPEKPPVRKEPVLYQTNRGEVVRETNLTGNSNLVKLDYKDGTSEYLKKDKLEGRKLTLAQIKTQNDEKQKQQEQAGAQPREAKTGTDDSQPDSKKQRKRVKGTRKTNREIRHPEQLQALNHEVTTPLDMVLQYFIGGGKVNASAIEQIFGNKRGKSVNAEVKSRVDLLDKTAPSLDEVAHKMWDNLSEEMQGKYDSQDFQNAVEGVLIEFDSRTKMARDLNKRFGELANEEDRAYIDYLDQAYDQAGSEDAVNIALDIAEPITDEEAERRMSEEKEGQEVYVNQLIAADEAKMEVIAKQQAEKDTLGKQVDDLKIYLDRLQNEYNKQKAALDKNGQQDQGDIFGGKPSDELLFKNDLSEQRKIVADIKTQLDSVKEFYNEAKNKFDNFAVGSMPMFSTKEDSDAFQTTDNRPATVDLLQKTYPDATIVQSQTDLPQQILDEVPEGKTVEGVLHNGVIYMVADNLPSMGRAEGVYKHEAVGHSGVIAELKDKLNPFVTSLVNNVTAQQRAALDKLSQKLFKKNSTELNEAQKNTLGQEYIAQAAEKPANYPTTWEKVKSFVRGLLRDLGIKLSVSDKDIKVLLDRAAKQRSNTIGTRFSISDDFAKNMQEMLRKAREAEQNKKEPDKAPGTLKPVNDYADEIIDWVKSQNPNASAEDVIKELEPKDDTERAELETYVREKFANQQQQGQQGQQQAAPQPTGKTEKLTDADTIIINNILNQKIDQQQYPAYFDMNAQLTQIAAGTQSRGQDGRQVLDGSYIEAHLADLKSISEMNARILADSLGKNWKEKLVHFLEDKPTAGDVAQVAGLLNVMSTQVFQEISKARSGSKISELKDLQARVDAIAYDNARSASLALNQRRLYQEFAQGKSINDILSEVILSPEQQQMKQAVEEALKQKFADEELNKPKAATPKTKTAKTTTTKKAPAPKSNTVKDDLIAKGKAAAQQKDEDGNVKNVTLADKLQQAKDALNGFKC